MGKNFNSSRSASVAPLFPSSSLSFSSASSSASVRFPSVALPNIQRERKRERERAARDIMRAINTVRGLRPRDVVLLKTRGKGGKKSGGEKEKKQRREKTMKRGRGKRGTISTMLFFLFPSLHEYSSTRICIGFSFEKKWSVAVRLVSGGGRRIGGGGRREDRA